MEGYGKRLVAKDLLAGLRCVCLGCYQSLLGIVSGVSLVQRNAKIRRQLLQCFLLNGVILGFSILVFDYVFLPVVQYCTGVIYGAVVSAPASDSLLLQWLTVILHYLFTGFWVLPVFWMSKPINGIWFQDIASTAFRETQKNKPQKLSHSPKSQSLSQSLSRCIADFLFSLLMELLFLLQSLLVGLVPGVGWILSGLHMAVLYSLYCFEYKWMYQGWIVHQRVAHMETHWPYFVGFGLPLAILTALPKSLVISACIFAVMFPLFIISANSAIPTPSPLPALPIFNTVVHLSNKLVRGTSKAYPRRSFK